MSARSYRYPRIPKGNAWAMQIFDKDIFLEPDGVVTRKVSSVKRQASEALLLHHCRKRDFVLTRMGTHYLIHKSGVVPKLCSSVV